MQPDEGQKQTDEELRKLEAKIKQVYSDAAKDMQETVDDYFDKFKARDAEMKALIGTEVNGNVWTENDYQQWRLNQMARGERFDAMKDKLSERATSANEVAVAYVNDATPGIYSLNRNYTAYTIEQIAGATDFTLWDESTVKRLIKEAPDLMPYYPKKKAVARGIDLEYGKKMITKNVTSSILQGKSIKGIADSLQKDIPTMNRTSAIRTARTAVTQAQNAGRLDSYAAAADMGIQVRKRWICVKDSRTRPDHQAADGQIVNWDEPFNVGGYDMMAPGDSSAPGFETYNCRCTMRTVEKEGIEAEPRMMRVRDANGRNVLVQEMTYKEWLEWKSS